MNEQLQLAQLLQQELALIDRVMTALDDEHAALAENQPETLERAVTSKRREVEQLETVSRQRKELMDRLLGADSAVTDVAELFGQDPELTRLWDTLTARARQCRDHNRQNGNIVEAVSRQLGQALDVLHGRHLAGSVAENLYDQSGQSVGAAVKHTLTQV